MKKSVVILIALIYVASIALVGFLGLKAKSFNDVIYVETLEILNEYSSTPDGTKYIILREGNTLQLECKVTPEDASDTRIDYYLQSDETRATIDQSGLLTFKPTEDKTPISVKVFIYAHQNTSIKQEITVYYVPQL